MPNPLDWIKHAAKNPLLLGLGLLCATNEHTQAQRCHDAPLDEGCGGDDEDCQSLYREIDRLVNQLQRRHRQLRENKGKLPLKGPNSIEGHQDKFRDRQQELRNALNKANAKGCNGYRNDAWTWATQTPPNPA